MSASLAADGPRVTHGEEDNDGHRTYTVVHQVITDDVRDGPATVMLCPGLPVEGTPWVIGNDADIWAWCQRGKKVAPVDSNENTKHWTVEQTFSTKPRTKCSDAKVEDPLLEPPKISGGFDKFTEEATHDMFGRRVLSSSHERIKGPQNEWDNARPTIKITQNVATPYLAHVLPSYMVNSVNAHPLWGIPARCIKLSNATWEQAYHGQCYLYYRRNLEFDVNFRTWDRQVLDEGNKCLRGKWEGDVWKLIPNSDGSLPDRNNPGDFDVFRTKSGQPSVTVLNGMGLPVGAKILASQFGQVIRRFICVRNTTAGFWPDRDLGYYASMNQDPSDGSHDLFDRQFWHEQVGSVTDWQQTETNGVSWENIQLGLVQFRKYTWGNVVKNNGIHYLCIKPNEGEEPLPGETNPEHWLQISYTSAGVWDYASDYAKGEYVEEVESDLLITRPGNVFIAKYPGADFSLLGIPLVF